MEFDLYCKLVDQFTNLKELHLQGLGEPMMHPRFFDMVEYAVQKGIRVTTNSNLTILNPRNVQRCITCGLDTIHVSIDGATKDTYEEIRVRAHFERVLHNLDLILDERLRRDSPLPHLKMVTVIMRKNLAELPDLVRLAHRLRMEEIFVQHLAHDFGESSLPAHYRPMREFVEAETLFHEDIERIETFFSKARQEAEELGIELRLPHVRERSHPPGTPGMDRCSWPWRGAYISYQGLAMPCCMVATPDRIQLGNMADQSVEQVWNGELYQNFRESLSSDNPSELCSSCSIYRGIF